MVRQDSPHEERGDGPRYGRRVDGGQARAYGRPASSIVESFARAGCHRIGAGARGAIGERETRKRNDNPHSGRHLWRIATRAALLQNGASPAPAGPADRKPLVRAAEEGNVGALALLLDAGAVPIPVACIAAAGAGTLEGLELLLSRGARLLAKDRKTAIAAALGPYGSLIRRRIEALSASKR